MFQQKNCSDEWIKLIKINLIYPVRPGNGIRYVLLLEKFHGKPVTVFFGRSRKNEKRLENLLKTAEEYNIEIEESI